MIPFHHTRVATRRNPRNKGPQGLGLAVPTQPWARGSNRRAPCEFLPEGSGPRPRPAWPSSSASRLVVSEPALVSRSAPRSSSYAKRAPAMRSAGGARGGVHHRGKREIAEASGSSRSPAPWGGGAEGGAAVGDGRLEHAPEHVEVLRAVAPEGADAARIRPDLLMVSPLLSAISPRRAHRVATTAQNPRVRAARLHRLRA